MQFTSALSFITKESIALFKKAIVEGTMK